MLSLFRDFAVCLKKPLSINLNLLKKEIVLMISAPELLSETLKKRDILQISKNCEMSLVKHFTVLAAYTENSTPHNTGKTTYTSIR